MTYVVYEFASFGSLVLNDDHGKQGPGGIEVLRGSTNQAYPSFFFYRFFFLKIFESLNLRGFWSPAETQGNYFEKNKVHEILKYSSPPTYAIIVFSKNLA